MGGLGGIPGLQFGAPRAAQQPQAQQPQPAVDELRLGTLDLSDLMAQFVNPVTQSSATQTAAQGTSQGTSTTPQPGASTPAPAPTIGSNGSVNESVGNIDTVARDLFPSTPAAAPTSMDVDTPQGEASLDDLAQILRWPLKRVIDAAGNLHPHVFQLPSSKCRVDDIRISSNYISGYLILFAVRVALSQHLPDTFHSATAMQELFTIHGPLKDALAQFGAIVHASPDGNDINERLQHLNVRGSDAASLYQVCHL
jgi:hypothetical protein